MGARGLSALRTGSVVVVAIAVVLVVSSSGFGKPPTRPLPTITIQSSGPEPASITITAGTPIAFKKVLPEGESQLVFDGVPCGESLVEIDPCSFTLRAERTESGLPVGNPFAWIPTVQLWKAGTFTYRIQGFGAGSGTVTIQPSGHIEAGTRIVTYGQRTRLQGLFSAANEWGPLPSRIIGLLVLKRPFGRKVFSPAAATRTNDAGRWHAWIAPKIETSYHLQDDDMSRSSEDIVVQVRPKVTLRAVSRRAFVTRVRALSSYAGKLANVERFAAGAWTTIQTVRLDSRSSAGFQLSGLPAGARIRVVVPESQAQPGYVAGFSRSLRLAS